MFPPVNDARALAQTAMTELGRGDALAARKNFEKIAADGLADASIYLGLAIACRSLMDSAGMTAAIDAALVIEPQNLRALVMKADQLAVRGDDAAAASFYARVLSLAAAIPDLPADFGAELARVQQICDRSVAARESFMRDRLQRMGFSGGNVSRRFAESLDILFGKKQVYVQQPRYYYFPELPQIQFYERAAFPWLDKVEAATAAIREELAAVMKADSTASPAFQPYVKANARRPYHPQDGMLNNPAWSAFYLVKDGEVQRENAARCPQTMAALSEVPLSQAVNRSPSILFSLLRPGAHIPPHNGLINTRLICHLPLIVPGKCRFRVGNETREWVEGKAWVFDDSIEHEAWNNSAQTRVILLFEIWRPELTLQERQQVSAMFEAIDADSRVKPVWEI